MASNSYVDFCSTCCRRASLKVRYYGWMASNSRTTRDRVKWLVWLFLGWTYWLGSGVAPQPDRYRIETSAVRTLRRHVAPDRDHRRQWSSPCESPAAVAGAGRSRHELSGQRMKYETTPGERQGVSPPSQPATSTPIFKTRITPCRIAVRADIKKSMHSKENRTAISVPIWTSLGSAPASNSAVRSPTTAIH